MPFPTLGAARSGMAVRPSPSYVQVVALDDPSAVAALPMLDAIGDTVGGETIQAVNLFSVTPWGTPQMVGVSGHSTYWNENPELLEKIANSYRANRWKLGG